MPSLISTALCQDLLASKSRKGMDKAPQNQDVGDFKIALGVYLILLQSL